MTAALCAVQAMSQSRLSEGISADMNWIVSVSGWSPPARRLPTIQRIVRPTQQCADKEGRSHLNNVVRVGG
jgi:hypothetical protein